MIMEALANRWVLWFVCSLLVFLEMFFVKKWYLVYTKKIKNVKAKTATNLILGLLTCFGLAIVQMWALCDVFNGVFYWRFVIAAALTATFVYLMIEKVFGNAETNKLGETFRSVLSHSDLFDGDISTVGVVDVAKRLHDVVSKIDKKKAEKENEAIEKMLSHVDSFLADGKITEEEKVQADAIFAKYSAEELKGNSTYERYVQLLNQK